MIAQHGCIEGVVANLPSRFTVPEDFEFQSARDEFLDPTPQFAVV